MRLDEAPQQSRSAQGKLIQELKPGDGITDLVAPREFLSSEEVAKEEQTPPAKRSRKTTGEKSPAATMSEATKPVPEKKAAAKSVPGKPSSKKPIAKKPATQKTESAKTASTKPTSEAVLAEKKVPAKSQKSTPAKLVASETAVKKKASPPPATQLTMPMDEKKGKSSTIKPKTKSSSEKSKQG
jgi:hypothetical protein